MPLPLDFVQNASGDLDLPLRQTSDLATFVRQKLSETLAFFLGEWFVDTRLGVPYFKWVFGQRPDVPLLTTLYRRAVLKTPGVADAVVALEYDSAQRNLSANITATLTTGDVVFADYIVSVS